MQPPLEFAILSDEISLDLDEALSEGEALGFGKYEIRCVDDYEYRVPFLKPGRSEQLQQQVDSGSIEVTALSPGVFKCSIDDDQAIRHHMDQTLPRSCEMAQRLKAPLVIVFGFLGSSPSGSRKAVELLREAGAIAQERGLRLAVENEPGSFCDTGQKIAKLIEEIALPNVGINWDPGNALSSGEVAYPIGYRHVRPYLMNLHIKDTIPLPNGKWENRLLGDGGVNWIGQLRALLNDRPLPHLTIETHLTPLLPSTRETWRRLQIYLETIKRLDSAQS